MGAAVETALVIALCLLAALGLLWADRQGENRRCAALPPHSYAHSVYCTSEGPQ
jgi:hypothetical protein